MRDVFDSTLPSEGTASEESTTKMQHGISPRGSRIFLLLYTVPELWIKSVIILRVANLFQDQFCTIINTRRDKIRKLFDNITVAHPYWITFYLLSYWISRYSVDNRVHRGAVACVYETHMYRDTYMYRGKEILFFCEKTKERNKRAKETEARVQQQPLETGYSVDRPVCLGLKLLYTQCAHLCSFWRTRAAWASTWRERNVRFR